MRRMWGIEWMRGKNQFDGNWVLMTFDLSAYWIMKFPMHHFWWLHWQLRPAKQCEILLSVFSPSSRIHFLLPTFVINEWILLYAFWSMLQLLKGVNDKKGKEEDTREEVFQRVFQSGDPPVSHLLCGSRFSPILLPKPGAEDSCWAPQNCPQSIDLYMCCSFSISAIDRLSLSLSLSLSLLLMRSATHKWWERASERLLASSRI